MGVWQIQCIGKHMQMWSSSLSLSPCCRPGSYWYGAIYSPKYQNLHEEAKWSRVREGRMHMGGDKTPSLPCCSSWIYIYRNPAATHTWFDDFVQMRDKVCESNPNIVLLGDFNIVLLKPQPTWSSAMSLFGLLCDKNNSNLCYIARSYIYK